MSAWSEQETELINEGYWQGRVPPCPRCGARVEVTRSKVLGYPKKLYARCVSCETYGTFLAAAAPGADFAAEQMVEFVDRFHRGLAVHCPHDGTEIEVRERRIPGPITHYFATCPRCGTNGQMSRRTSQA